MKLNRDKGISTVLAVSLIMVIVIFVAAFYEGYRMFAIVEQVDQAVELSVQGVAQENWENVYQAVREGYAGTYTKKELEDDWEEVMNKEQILKQLQTMIDFDKENGEWVRRDDQSGVLFSLKPDETTVTIINTNLAAEEGDALVVETTNTITIPWIFLDAIADVPPLVVHRKTVCGYTPRF